LKKDGMTKLLKPGEVTIKGHTKGSKETVLNITRSKMAYMLPYSGAMVKLPGESASKTGTLKVYVIAGRDIPDGVMPVVLVKKVDKHLNHGGHHIEKSTVRGVRDDVNGGGRVTRWDGKPELSTLDFQITEHTLSVKITMYDSANFAPDRWQVEATIELKSITGEPHVTRIGAEMAVPLDYPKEAKTVIFGEGDDEERQTELHIRFDYRAKGEGIPDWHFLTQFGSDNERFKREDCESCGIDGWVFTKKSDKNQWRRSWMCITNSPRRLVIVKNCENESELNKLGRMGHLRDELITIPAPQIVELRSGLGVPKKFSVHASKHELEAETTFTMTRKAQALEDTPVRNGIIRIGDIHVRKLDGDLLDGAELMHASVQLHHYHRDGPSGKKTKNGLISTLVHVVGIDRNTHSLKVGVRWVGGKGKVHPYGFVEIPTKPE